MPLISEIILLQKEMQNTLTIRLRTPVEYLPKHIGESYSKISSYMNEAAALPSDVPFVIYHNMDMQDLDVEIGFAVPTALPEKGDIKPGTIPPGKSIFAMYLGPYSEMAQAYEEMGRYISDNKLEPSGQSYEYYYNGPETPPDQMLTKIVFPLK